MFPIDENGRKPSFATCVYIKSVFPTVRKFIVFDEVSLMKRNGPATKNKKYLAILLVVIMVFSVFVIFFGNSLKTGSNNDFSTKAVEDNSSTIPFSQIPGKHINHKFNSIVDGLNMSSEGVMSAIYIDLQKSKGTPLETLFKSKDLKDFYGVDVTRCYRANYANGTGFELNQIPEQKILMPWGSVPYHGYNLHLKTNNTYNQWTVVGNPVISGSRQSVKDVIDIMEKNKTSTREYDQILSQVEPVNVIIEEVVTKNNVTNIPAEQYYMDLKKLDNGSYMQTFMFLNSEPKVTKNIAALKASSNERGVTYDVINSGNIIKLKINSDFASLNNETKLLSL